MEGGELFQRIQEKQAFNERGELVLRIKESSLQNLTAEKVAFFCQKEEEQDEG